MHRFPLSSPAVHSCMECSSRPLSWATCLPTYLDGKPPRHPNTRSPAQRKTFTKYPRDQRHCSPVVRDPQLLVRPTGPLCLPPQRPNSLSQHLGQPLGRCCLRLEARPPHPRTLALRDPAHGLAADEQPSEAHITEQCHAARRQGLQTPSHPYSQTPRLPHT